MNFNELTSSFSLHEITHNLIARALADHDRQVYSGGEGWGVRGGGWGVRGRGWGVGGEG